MISLVEDDTIACNWADSPNNPANYKVLDNFDPLYLSLLNILHDLEQSQLETNKEIMANIELAESTLSDDLVKLFDGE